MVSVSLGYIARLSHLHHQLSPPPADSVSRHTTLAIEKVIHRQAQVRPELRRSVSNNIRRLRQQTEIRRPALNCHCAHSVVRCTFWNAQHFRTCLLGDVSHPDFFEQTCIRTTRTSSVTHAQAFQPVGLSASTTVSVE